MAVQEYDLTCDLGSITLAAGVRLDGRQTEAKQGGQIGDYYITLASGLGGWNQDGRNGGCESGFWIYFEGKANRICLQIE